MVSRIDIIAKLNPGPSPGLLFLKSLWGEAIYLIPFEANLT
jgi:hypothetical protein